MSGLQYFNLSQKEPLIPNNDITIPNMNANVKNSNLERNMDISTKVNVPHGYGYNAPLTEVRNNDAIEIQNQQSIVFSLGAVAGVSLIVFGLLMSSSSDGSPTLSK
jgi:hypothetical protein